MKKTIRVSLSLLVATLIIGCADKTPQLTTAAIMQQYSGVSALNTQLQEAKYSGVDFLSPESYAKANEIYNDAFDRARNQEKDADALAQKGLTILQKSVAQAKSNKLVMQEVVDARQKAIDVGAPVLYADKYEKLEKQLRKSTNALEHGNLEKGKEDRLELIKSYAALELASLQDTTTEQAEKAIAAAKKADADEYAPKTLKLAEESLALASNILGAGRTQTQKASAHAQEAVYLANKSIQITKIAKAHKKHTFEEVMFWYQDQLETLNAPLEEKLSFDKENQAIVAQIRTQIAQQIRLKKEAEASLAEFTERNAALSNEIKALGISSDEKFFNMSTAHKNETQELQAAHAKKISEMELKYSQQVKGLTAEIKGSEESFKQQISDIKEANRKAQERYDSIAQMFTLKEANVYRQGNNVLLETHAFNFEVGKSEIGTQNFGLLEKILEASRKFDNPHILIMGHTDATGSAELNLKLSQKRSDAVKKFFVEIGKFQTEKIQSEGHGEAHPVATNETAEGRERNRRIEVLIINN